MPECHGQAHESRPHPLERYYRLHSWIYDATRWSFLFGRNELMQTVSDIAQSIPCPGYWLRHRQ